MRAPQGLLPAEVMKLQRALSSKAMERSPLRERSVGCIPPDTEIRKGTTESNETNGYQPKPCASVTHFLLQLPSIGNSE
jgi:hypothetical protein